MVSSFCHPFPVLPHLCLMQYFSTQSLTCCVPTFFSSFGATMAIRLCKGIFTEPFVLYLCCYHLDNYFNWHFLHIILVHEEVEILWEWRNNLVSIHKNRVVSRLTFPCTVSLLLAVRYVLTSINKIPVQHLSLFLPLYSSLPSLSMSLTPSLFLP